jgi:hypothetical protein
MVFNDILGFRSFATEDDIKTIVAQSRYSRPEENYRSAKTLLIFATSKQQTWLVKTDRTLYVVLDDRRKERPRVEWSMPVDEAQRARVASRDYTRMSGMIDIGPQKEWLYTKKLFQEENIENVVTRFIADTSSP